MTSARCPPPRSVPSQLIKGAAKGFHQAAYSASKAVMACRSSHARAMNGAQVAARRQHRIIGQRLHRDGLADRAAEPQATDSAEHLGAAVLGHVQFVAGQPATELITGFLAPALDQRTRAEASTIRRQGAAQAARSRKGPSPAGPWNPTGTAAARGSDFLPGHVRPALPWIVHSNPILSGGCGGVLAFRRRGGRFGG